MSDEMQYRPSLLRSASMPAHLQGAHLNVMFDAKARLDLETELKLPRGSLAQIEQKIKSDIRNLIPTSSQARYGVFLGKSEMSIGVRNLSAEQREYLVSLVKGRIRTAGEQRDEKGSVVDLTPKAEAILAKYATVGFGAAPRPTAAVSLPSSFGAAEVRALRNKLRSAYGPSGNVSSLIGEGSARYIPGAMSAVAGPRGGHQRITEAIHTAVREVQKERDDRIAQENKILSSAFPGSEAVAEDDPRRPELIREAIKIEREKTAAGMSDERAKAAASARLAKAARVQSATEAAIQARAVERGFSDDRKGAARFAALHNISAGEWTRISPELRDEIGKQRILNRLETQAADDDYIRKKEILNLAARDRRSDARDEYYTTGAGANTEQGRKYRRMKGRRQDIENMRGSGRTGALLKKLGVSSKTAGAVGRVFGKAGAAMIIVGAILALGKLLVSAIQKAAEQIVKTGAESSARFAISTNTGMSQNDAMLFTSVANLTKEATSGVGTVDFNQFTRSVAGRLGSFPQNTEGLSMALSGMARMTAGGGTFDPSVILDFALKNQKDASLVSTYYANQAILGLVHGRGIFGAQKGNVNEVAAFMEELGQGGGEFIRGWYNQVRQNSAAQNYIRNNERLAVSDPREFNRGLIRTMYPAASLQASLQDTGIDAVVRDLMRAIQNIQESFAGMFSWLGRQFQAAFGPTLIQAVEGFNRLLLGLVVRFAPLFGIDARPMVASYNRDVERQMRERIQSNIGVERAITGDIIGRTGQAGERGERPTGFLATLDWNNRAVQNMFGTTSTWHRRPETRAATVRGWAKWARDNPGRVPDWIDPNNAAQREWFLTMAALSSTGEQLLGQNRGLETELRKELTPNDIRNFNDRGLTPDVVFQKAAAGINREIASGVERERLAVKDAGTNAGIEFILGGGLGSPEEIAKEAWAARQQAGSVAQALNRDYGAGAMARVFDTIQGISEFGSRVLGSLEVKTTTEVTINNNTPFPHKVDTNTATGAINTRDISGRNLTQQ